MKKYCKKQHLYQFWEELAIVHQLNVVKYKRDCTYRNREVNKMSSVPLHNGLGEIKLTKEACRINQ